MIYVLILLLQDALRLYLINSPVVRAEPLRFKKEGVYGVVSIFTSSFVLGFSPLSCT